MKHFTIILLILIGQYSLAQNIPNGDFENWSTRHHPTLRGWFSPLRNVERTTDAKIGTYALKLSNTYSETGNGTRGYALSINSGDKSSLNGFAFDGDPLSLVFWSKHDLAAGDTARIYAVFREKGAFKGSVDFRFSGSTNGEFVKYNVPISWNSTRTSDTAWLYLYSYIKNKVEGDGYVIYDDVHFEKIGERQDDIINHSFEDWDTIDLDYPTAWRTIDLREYDNYTRYLPNQATFQVSGSEAFRGNSLKIKNYDHNGSLRAGYAYIGTEEVHANNAAFAVSDSFTYLQGYYKYTPDTTDNARILLRMYQGTNRMSYDNIYLEEAREWTFFSAPINYGNSKGTPDSAAIRAWSTTISQPRGENTALYLDNLELVMEPTPLTMSIQDQFSESSVSIYPNPTNNSLHYTSIYPITRCTVISPLGVHIELRYTDTNIDISTLNAGLYYLRLYQGETFQTFKLLKNE